MFDNSKKRRQPWLEKIPKAEVILEETIIELNKSLELEEKIRAGKISPSDACRMLEKECYKRYLKYEEEVKDEYRKQGWDMSKIEKSLMQSRAPRAGRTTELILYKLLDILGIPCETNVWYPKKDGEKLDIVIPDKSTLQLTPENAIIISVKREVRERWREVVGEAYLLRKLHKVPDNIWFVTVTGDISEYIVSSMTQLEIRVYIPDEYYESFRKFGARKLSSMFDDIISFLNKKGIKRKVQMKLA